MKILASPKVSFDLISKFGIRTLKHKNNFHRKWFPIKLKVQVFFRRIRMEEILWKESYQGETIIYESISLLKIFYLNYNFKFYLSWLCSLYIILHDHIDLLDLNICFSAVLDFKLNDMLCHTGPIFIRDN